MLFIVVCFFSAARLVPLAILPILAILAMDMNFDSVLGHIFTLQGRHTLEMRPQFIFFSYLGSSSQFIVILAISVFVFWQTSCTAICEMKLTAHWPASECQWLPAPCLSRSRRTGQDWPVSRPSFPASPTAPNYLPCPAPIMNIYEDLKNIFFASVVL